MWIWQNALVLIGGIAGLATDITTFFVIVRLLYRRRYSPLLRAFDLAGTLLVDGFVGRVVICWMRLGRPAPASESARLLMALICLVMLRLLAAALLAGVMSVRL